MSAKVEQVDPGGRVVLDEDAVLSPAQMQAVLEAVPGLELVTNSNPYEAYFQSRKVVICVKNITYLGNPHPTYKKRIQISEGYKKALQRRNALLLGIYSYGGALTFCSFDPRTYRERRLNSSSAHVSVLDLRNGMVHGVFRKTDKFGNRLVVCKAEHLPSVLQAQLEGGPAELLGELDLIKSVFEAIPRRIVGTEAIQEMLDWRDPNALQAEWPGFYVEHYFKRYLSQNQSNQRICVFASNKAKGQLDLDVHFVDKNFPGDLKVHTIGTDLLGNDKDAIDKAIRLHDRVWYIVLEHTTILDREMGGVTAKFWNEQLNQRARSEGTGKIKKLDSYAQRMKHTVSIERLRVLELTKDNLKHLADFLQGRNSNSRARKPKIMIRKRDLENDNFVVFRLDLKDRGKKSS